MSDTASNCSEYSADSLLSAVKGMNLEELMKTMKMICSEVEKKTKGVKPAAEKKSARTGVTPPQLRKNHEWVAFVLRHAINNGWEAFEAKETKRDKTVEIVKMSGSIEHDESYVFEGSVTEKCPAGEQLTHKHAMSLSKQYWSVAAQKGSQPALYQEFLDGYQEDDSVEAAVAAVAAPAVVRKTAAEKAAEKEAADKIKAAEKEKKAAEKAAAKAAKDAEKAAAKAEKDAEKAAAKAEKEAAKAPKKTPVKAAKAVTPPSAPIKAAKKPVEEVDAFEEEAATATATAAAPIAAAVVARPMKKKEAKKEQEKEAEWVTPAEGVANKWKFKGKSYLRNADNEVWAEAADGSLGAWCGIYREETKSIDDSVPEPEYDE